MASSVLAFIVFSIAVGRATGTSTTMRWFNKTQRTPHAPAARNVIPSDHGAANLQDVAARPERTWQPWTDFAVNHTRAYDALREAGSFGNWKYAENYFVDRAVSIVRAHEDQTLGTVVAMRAKWHNKTLIGRVRPWELIQRLALTVDHTDVMLRTTSQWIHTLQVYEGMLLDGINDERLLLLALVHDVGKTLSLFGEDDANVDGLNVMLLEAGVIGGGMETVTTQWNHDEFGYQKLRRYIPPDIAWVIRWHSCVPLVEGKLEHILTPQEHEWLPMLRTLYEYDHKTKSFFRMPEIDHLQARAIVEKFLPEIITF